MNNGDKSYRISVYIGLANLIILILRGILGYILIGRYEVKKNVVQTEESQASKELMNINKELQKLDLSVKEYRDGLDVQGREIQNKLNKLELDIRVVKNNLEITGKKLGLSSDIMLLANDVIPKASLEYDASRSAPINEQKRGGNKIVHNLSNVGKYPIQVTRCVIFVTKVPLSEDDQAKEKLIEGKDYTLEEEFSFIGFLSS